MGNISNWCSLWEFAAALPSIERPDGHLATGEGCWGFLVQPAQFGRATGSLRPDPRGTAKYSGAPAALPPLPPASSGPRPAWGRGNCPLDTIAVPVPGAHKGAKGIWSWWGGYPGLFIFINEHFFGAQGIRGVIARWLAALPI